MNTTVVYQKSPTLFRSRLFRSTGQVNGCLLSSNLYKSIQKLEKKHENKIVTMPYFGDRNI